MRTGWLRLDALWARHRVFGRQNSDSRALESLQTGCFHALGRRNRPPAIPLKSLDLCLTALHKVGVVHGALIARQYSVILEPGKRLVASLVAHGG